MNTWIVAAHTPRGSRSIVGFADTNDAARRAALRCAHTLARAETPYTRYELHADHQLLAIVTAKDTTSCGRPTTQHLLDRLNHPIDPYAD